VTGGEGREVISGELKSRQPALLNSSTFED